MYSGVSGMKINQTKMDVIANNISNVSTTAFKSSRVRFEDLFSYTMAGAQAPTDVGRGGINPKQVGQGANISAVDTIFDEGSLQPTGRDLDFAIEGNGFFLVSEDADCQIIRYTRDGAFYKDYDGNLVTAGGLRVVGFGVNSPTGEIYTTDMNEINDANGTPVLTTIRIPDVIDVGGVELRLQSFTVDTLGLISAVYDDGQIYYFGRVALANFANPGGLSKLGNNTYAATNNSGMPQIGNPGQAGLGIIRQSNLEMSNVDLANEFTEMIITSRAYQANSRIITTSDEMLHDLVNLKR